MSNRFGAPNASGQFSTPEMDPRGLAPQVRHEQSTYGSYAESTSSQLTSPDRHIGQESAAATRQS